MNQEINKAYIKNFLKNNRLAILSTVDEKGLPHAAPIYYISDEALNFFFVTPIETQKSINIDFQNEVVLTITDEQKKETVEVKGKSKKDKTLLGGIIEKLAKKLNENSKFNTNLPLLSHKNQERTVVIINPYEIRMRKYYEDRLEEKTLKLDK